MELMPTEADKAAADDIAQLAKEYFDSSRPVGPLLVAYSADIISQHMAPERSAAAALQESLWTLEEEYSALESERNAINVLRTELREENKRLRVALNEAICRPKGVVPDSAAEFYKPY